VKLGELWAALCTGDAAVLDAAYLHRVHRERGRVYLKGREDIAADWGTVLGLERQCEVVADLGDAAVVRLGGRSWHHWVRRESGWIAREVLVVEGGPGLDDGHALVTEREINSGSSRMQLAHLFTEAAEGSPLRHVVSRFTAGGDARLQSGKRSRTAEPHSASARTLPPSLIAAPRARAPRSRKILV
jgi:hypothetical protein